MKANSKSGVNAVEIQCNSMFECIREENHNEYKFGRWPHPGSGVFNLSYKAAGQGYSVQSTAHMPARDHDKRARF